MVVVADLGLLGGGCDPRVHGQAGCQEHGQEAKNGDEDVGPRVRPQLAVRVVEVRGAVLSLAADLCMSPCGGFGRVSR